MTILSIDQQPQAYSPGYNENMYLATSSGTAQTNFRYVFDVYASNGSTLIARVKLPARPTDNKGLFDAKRIIENYLSYDLPTANENAGFYQNSQSFHKYTIKVGEEYDVAGTLTHYYAQRTISGKFIWNAALEWLEFRDFLYTDYLLTAGLTGHPFLTNSPSTQRIESSQNAWLYMTTATSGSIKTAEFKKYDANNVLLDSKYISSSLFNLTTSDGNRFLRLACGTANMEHYSPGWLTGADHYTVQVMDSTSGLVSQMKRYDIAENCRFATVRLHWLNKLGGFDSFNFTMKSREGLVITKQQYKKRYGADTGAWSYGSHDRGDVIFDSRGKQEFNINSDWITEEESVMAGGAILISGSLS
jgi:hypothetical protein